MQSMASISLLGSPAAGLSRQAAPRRPAHARSLVVASFRGTAPKGVTQPPVQPQAPKPMFGFVDTAETWNSRAAMIGFFSLLALELIANRGILDMMGVATGKGLSIGF